MPEIVFYSILAFAILIGLTVGATYVFTRRWCTPERLASAKTPNDMGMIFEGVSFKSGRGTIRGWYVPPAGSGDSVHQGPSVSPAIVIAHGWSSNAAKLLRIAKHMSREGFRVLLYDARAHGASDWDGPMTVFRLSEDVVAAVDYLCTRADLDPGRIGVLGHSMGGSASILAASRDERIRAVVSCAAPADTVRMTARYLRRRRLPVWPFLGIMFFFIGRWSGASREDHVPRERIGKIQVPVLLAHGSADDFSHPSNMDELYAHSDRSRTETLLIEGARHYNVLQNEEFRENIVEFFNKNLTSI